MWKQGELGWPGCAHKADTLFSQRIIFSTPFAIISYILIWFVPDISTGQVMWYLVFYCAFQTLVTVSQALLTPGMEAANPCLPLAELHRGAETPLPQVPWAVTSSLSQFSLCHCSASTCLIQH